jgi:hypothetical protein
MERVTPGALEQFLRGSRGSDRAAGDQPSAADPAAWRERHAPLDAHVLVLERRGEVHGVVAARPTPLWVGGRPVDAFQVTELAVGPGGTGGARSLTRELLSRPHLYFGMANRRVTALWRRSSGARFMVVGPLRVLSLPPARPAIPVFGTRGGLGARRVDPGDAAEAARLADWVRTLVPASAIQPVRGPDRFTAAGAGPSQEKWVLHADGRPRALVQIEEAVTDSGPVLLARDLVCAADDPAALRGALRHLRRAARRRRARRVLLPSIGGPAAPDRLSALGAAPMPGWDPGPTLILHEGRGGLDPVLLAASANWDLPGWVTI